MTPAAIKSARSPVVRARETIRGPVTGTKWITRGEYYELEPLPSDIAPGNIEVLDNEGLAIRLFARYFDPANRAARRLLAKPVPAEVRRYRRRVILELTRARDASETNARWGALNEAIRIVRKVKP